ncbi:MAG: NAD+ synthase [Pseudohongiellaceae bacterium]
MAQQFNIVLAQLNLLVGAIDVNTERVISNARDAIRDHRADMIVFPELTLTGYPPEDLLLRPSLELRIQRALERILAAALDITIVFGFPEREGNSLFNALAVIRGGEVLGTYRKQRLPSYQVFDEHRYFAPGDSPCLVELSGTRIAFTICEDMWEAEPGLQARDAGAQLLININASPFHIDKLSQRQALLQKRAGEGGFPVVYVNMVGGQDELVFDGGSMAVSSKGDCRFLAPNYSEGLYPLAIEVGADGRCQIPRQDRAPGLSREAQVYQALVLGMRDYVDKNGFSGVVLGLSGGIDSALTLVVAVDALGKERVEAVMMPFEYTSELSLEVAAEQASRLGVNYQIIAIDRIYEAFMEALQGEFAGKPADVSEQNLQARARGVLLMAISNKKGVLVLTTGNKSELAVGYSTLYGDMAGGFDVLKDVSKTLVYGLARYRNQEYGAAPSEVIPQRVIDRPPSAELAPGQLDADSLPPYDRLDQILELYIEQDLSAATIIARGYDEAEVQRVLRLVDRNEYKRRQSPIGVRLTQRGFGRDRRYPITNAWPLGD